MKGATELTPIVQMLQEIEEFNLALDASSMRDLADLIAGAWRGNRETRNHEME